MPVSRPILIALAGALLVLVAFVASNAMRAGDESSPPPPKPARASTPEPAKTKGAEGSRSARPAAAKSAGRSRARTDATSSARRGRAAAGVALRVQRAVDSGRLVVLFFYQRGGADDSATAESVAALRGRRGIAVFSAPVSRLGDFRAVTGPLGISQAPAVVILGKRGKERQARVVEGFVDTQTLAQEVADTR